MYCRDPDNKLQSAVEFRSRSGKTIIERHLWETPSIVFNSDGSSAEVTFRPDILPDKQKIILVGIKPEANSPVKFQFWRSGNLVRAMTEKGSLSGSLEISEPSSQHRMEFSYESQSIL